MTAAGETADGAHVELRGVHMAFGKRTVFRGLSCRFPRGGIAVILGGSGSGKSTVLRLIGGLVRPRAGTIVVDGTDVVGASRARLVEVRRKLGMMFQGGALLDSMTVFDNLAFPLREHAGIGEDEIRATVRARLEAVGLTNVEDLLPGQLSGGMVKRVALARAIIGSPTILLCDEPFSGLDPISTRRIELLLQDINQRLGMTIVLVSHDVASMRRIADTVLILLPEGAVAGEPAALRQNPDRRVAAFLDQDADLAGLVGTDDAPVEQTPGGRPAP